MCFVTKDTPINNINSMQVSCYKKSKAVKLVQLNNKALLLYINALGKTCVDYIVEYNSKLDSMVVRHEKTTTRVNFQGTYEFLVNAQSRARTVIRSSRVNTSVLASALNECITHVEDGISNSRLCVCVQLVSCSTNLSSNSYRTCLQMSSLN